MPNANLLRPDSHIHSLLIGPSGAGKTVAACSFPGRTHVLDFDDRIKGIIGAKFLRERIAKGEIEWTSIRAWQSGKALGIEDIYKILEPIDIRVNKREIDNVVLDSTSSMVQFFINYSINRDSKESGGATNIKHHILGSVPIPQKQDYNYTAVCMRNIIYDNLKSFPCNVFISSHLKDKVIASPTTEDPDRTIVVGRTLKAPGQLADDIPTWMDETWEFQIDDSIKSQPPRRYIVFKSAIAKTCFEIGEMQKSGIKEEWVEKHRLDITDRSLYEVLKPSFERMKVV